MKRLLILVGIAATMLSCNQQQPQTAQTAAATGAAAKIAYINNDTLSTYYKYAEDRFEEFQKKVEKGDKQLQSRASKLQKELASFEKRVQAGLVSQNEYNKKGAELMQKRDQLAVAQQSQAQGLAAEEMEIKNEIREKIKGYLDNYSKDKNYSIVLGYDQATATLIWSTPNAEDITWDIINGLNGQYESDQKAEETAASTDKKEEKKK
ncbi:OmpH family outer membrane protein [Limibacter armeniacum]|uniref:OmpH family outer membrane protein n=1 Tax=Limibacter armeniacum TaxID=466084 RepID=UPI002FE5B0CC